MTYEKLTIVTIYVSVQEYENDTFIKKCSI